MITVLTAHQPLYLPWLGFFHKIACSDIFCLWDDVQFCSKDFIHRNKIKNPNGPMWLTVPMHTKGYRNKVINEMMIDNSKPWTKKQWKSIEISYQKAPYFDSYKDFFEDLYGRKWEKIAELDEYIIRYLLKEIGIDVELLKASNMNFEGKKSERVLDMCKKIGADIYIFGELGKDYAKIEDFEKENVKIYFQNYNHPVYPQLFGDFVSHLSVIDLLFNRGEKSLEHIMNDNVTKNDILKTLKYKP